MSALIQSVAAPADRRSRVGRLGRWRRRLRRIAPSRAAVYWTLFLAGVLGYLLLVVLMIRSALVLVQRLGAGPVAAVIFVLLAGLALGFNSRRIRRRVWLLVTRHLFASKYERGAVWERLSETLSDARSEQDILERVARFAVRTMGVRWVELWMRARTRDGFVLATVAGQSVRSPGYPEPGSEAIESWLASGEVGESEDGEGDAAGVALRERLGATLIVPLRTTASVLGFIATGPEVTGGRFDGEDAMLLRSITTQAASALLATQLSEELIASRGVEAVHRMTSFVLHDLKNLVNLQALVLENATAHGQSAEFIRDAMRTFATTTDRMRRLIATLAAPQSRLDLRRERVSPLAILEAALADVRLERCPNVGLVRAYAPAAAAEVVLGDPWLLQRVLVNLLLNACQSLPGERGTITLSIRREREWVHLDVGDTGIGMSEEFLRRDVFRPFRTTKAGGTGIGLFQCRAVVEAHGGRILIDSQQNRGTTVTVILPAASTETRPAAGEYA
jgi:putative PEP-CTERM system histidine kinase